MAGTSRVHSMALLLLAGILLLPSLAGAEEPRAKERRLARQTLTTLWNALPEAWTRLKRAWEGEGSSLDPFGQPTDQGGSADPLGGPNQPAHGDTDGARSEGVREKGERRCQRF